MRNQWRISINAAAIIGMKAIANRAICFDAQGCQLPLAAEYSIAKPMLEIMQSSRIRPQLIPRTRSAKVSSRWPISAEKLVMPLSGWGARAVFGQRRRHRYGDLGDRVGLWHAPRRVALLHFRQHVA